MSVYVRAYVALRAHICVCVCVCVCACVVCVCMHRCWNDMRAFQRWLVGTLQCVAAFQCVAVCCSVLQCVAVCCSVLQCVAVCCSVLQ